MNFRAPKFQGVATPSVAACRRQLRLSLTRRAPATIRKDTSVESPMLFVTLPVAFAGLQRDICLRHLRLFAPFWSRVVRTAQVRTPQQIGM